MDQNKTLADCDRLALLDTELRKYRKKHRLVMVVLLAIATLSMTANFEGIKNAYAAAIMYMGASNNAGSTATTLHGTNSQHVHFVQADPNGYGHAIRAEQENYYGDAIHAWIAPGTWGRAIYAAHAGNGAGVRAESVGGYAVDAESTYSDAIRGEAHTNGKAGIYGKSSSGPGGYFYGQGSGYGSIQLAPKNDVTPGSSCVTGNIAFKGDSTDGEPGLYICYMPQGNSNSSWHRLTD